MSGMCVAIALRNGYARVRAPFLFMKASEGAINDFLLLNAGDDLYTNYSKSKTF